MASYNWKDHAALDLWLRYQDAPLFGPARTALEQARGLAADYIGRAGELAHKSDRPPPDQLELALDLLLHARAEVDQSPFAELFGGNPAFDGLVALRRAANWDGRDRGAEPAIACPRLFISHRQVDYPLALRIARVATDAGIEFWLDVLDPTLTWLNTVGKRRFTVRQEQLLIAVVVEMALLHSSHVMAVMTTNTIGSGWVGYEYGRVKDSGPFSLQAGCWIHPGLGRAPWEYLLLGVNTHDENGITRWLRGELTAWARRCGANACEDAARGGWRTDWGDPPPLPGS
jgi:hypothetical protein